LIRILIAVTAIVVLTVAPSRADAATEPRVALVIGNSAYADIPLANPVNDARLMSETLRGLGFDVVEVLDANQNTMKYCPAPYNWSTWFEIFNDDVDVFGWQGSDIPTRMYRTCWPDRAQSGIWWQCGDGLPVGRHQRCDLL